MGSAAAASAASSSNVETGEDYYEKLGVTKIINAAGTYTALTASIMPPSVQAAVARAAKHPVRLGRTAEGGGRVPGQEAEVRGAMVTAGAASALTLGTAGCITAANKCGIRAIPTEVRGLPKHEVIIQKGHRYGYDQATAVLRHQVRRSGDLAEYEAAFNEQR